MLKYKYLFLSVTMFPLKRRNIKEQQQTEEEKSLKEIHVMELTVRA